LIMAEGPKKILLSGSSGLIGTALSNALRGAGRPITPLIRHRGGPPESAFWDPLADQLDAAPLAGTDAVIHLAGENLADGRWTAARKKRITDSRVLSTALLAKTIATLQPLPRVMLCASAIGYYGNRGDQLLDESAPPGEGFAADLCRRWEQAAAPASAAGIRVVHLRLGVVLDRASKAMTKMVSIFRLGLGGVLGSGCQYVAWIALDDAVAAILHLLDHSQLSGPVNLVAPQAVTNRELTKALGRALHRPTIIPVPAFAAHLAFGEMADELLLSSTRVVPRRLLDDGFKFRFPQLDAAFQHMLKSPNQ